MAIHFKFRSAVEYDSIDIEGPFISIGALKEKIVEHKNLTRATDFDLLITNAQTSEGKRLEVHLIRSWYIPVSLKFFETLKAFLAQLKDWMGVKFTSDSTYL